MHHISHVELDSLVHSQAKPSQGTSCDFSQICRVAVLHDVDTGVQGITAVPVEQACLKPFTFEVKGQHLFLQRISGVPELSSPQATESLLLQYHMLPLESTLSSCTP